MPKYKIGSRILDIQEDKVDEFLTTAQSIGDNPVLIEETQEAGKTPPQVTGAPVEETAAPDMVSTLEPTSLELPKTEDNTWSDIFSKAASNFSVQLANSWNDVKLFSIDWLKNVAGEDASDFLIDPNLGIKGISYIDPETSKEINFSSDPEKWKELSALDARTDTDIKKVYSESDIEVGKATEKKMIELFNKGTEYNLKVEDIGGFIEGAKEKDIKKVVGGGLTAISSLVTTMVPAIATRGASLYPQIAGQMYSEYNKQKAVEKYGDDPEAVNKLIQNNEIEITTPMALAGISTALESVGIKGVTKAIAASPLKGKGAVLTLWASLGEGSTEYAQSLVETYNSSLGAGKTNSEALEDVVDAMSSEESWEAAIQGAFGGGIVSAGGRGIKKLATKTRKYSVGEISKDLNNLGILRQQEVEEKDNEVKEAIKTQINDIENSLRSKIQKSNKVIENLTEEELKDISKTSVEIDEISEKVKSLNKKLDKGLISVEKRNISVESYKKQYLQKEQKLRDVIKQVNERLVEEEVKIVSKFLPEELKPEILNNSEEILQKYPELNEQDVISSDGFVLDGKIIINKDVASRSGAITVGSHELLHNIISKAFKVSDVKNKQEIRRVESLTRDFIKVLKDNNVLDPIQKRIEENYMFDESKAETKPLYTYAEEYVTAFSDALGKNEIKINQNLFEKVQNFFKKIFKQYDYNKDFKTGKDLFDFVVEYRKNIKKGVVGERAEALLKEQGFIKDEVKFSKTQQELNDRVDKLVGDKDAQGNYKYASKAEFQSSENFINAYNEIIEGDILRPLITRGIEGNSVYGKPIEDFVQEVKDGLAEVLIRFDPTQNNSLIGFINTQLRFRKGDVLNKYKKQSSEQSIDVEVGEVGSLRELATEEQEFELTTERDVEEQDAGIKPADLLKENGHSDLVEKLSSDIEKLDVENLTFKTIPNMAAEVVSEATGIPVSKILDPKKNLSTGEARSAQEFIYKNIDAILKLLPQGAVTEAASETLLGTSTGMPKNLLKNFYEKDPVRRTEAQGLYEFKKLDNINKDTALAFFGIMPDGSAMPGFSGRTPESQTIKALSNVLGKLATNSAVRDLLKQQGFNPNVVQNIAAGKSPAMFSKTIKTKRAENLVDMLSVLDNNANIDDVRSLLSRAGLSNIEIEDFVQGYEKYLNNNKEKNVNKGTAESIQDYLNNKDKFELLNTDQQVQDVVGAYGVNLTLSKNGIRNEYGNQLLNDFWNPFFKEFTSEGKNVENVKIFLNVLFRPFSHGKNSTYSLFNGYSEIASYFNKIIVNKDLKISTNDKGGLLLKYKNKEIHKFSTKRFDYKIGLKEAHDNNDFSIMQKAYEEQAIIARKHLEVFIVELNKFINKPSANKKQNKHVTTRAINSLIKITDTLLRLAAKPTVFLKQEGSFENSKYDFEHRPPISMFNRYLLSSLYNNDIDIQEILKGLSSLEGGFVPKKVHEEINETHKTTMQKGYRFGDDAWKLYDLKGESVQKIPEVKSSKTTTDNVQLEEKMAGIISSVDPRITPGQQLDLATARNLAATRRKRRDIIAPSADDFDGLIYRFLSKGKLGEEQYQFFKDNLHKPYGEAYYKLNLTRQRVSDQFKNINKQNKSLVKKLKQDSGFGGYTFEQALRVWLFQKADYTPSGLNEDTIEVLIKIVKNNPDIEAYGQSVSSILPITQFWVEPDANNWQIDTIKTDVIDAIEKVTRKQFLDEWKTNVDQIFSKNNMNKITAAFGEDFTDALKDMLYRMETGSSRPEGADKQMKGFMNWVRGSVAVTMFFNTRSAILQQISLVNFINWGDNNPLKAAATVANINQYSKDFAFIFNSEYLKQRRGGLKTDVNAADLAEAIKKGGYKGALAQLLQAGFSLTQLGDSFAISTGGASFYRNRINTYKSQGMSVEAAEKQAFLDFQELSEEAQQSARPDRLSKQQTNNIGRVFLAFQNTPMQMTRLMVKAAKDLKAGRGDAKTNISKIVYYGFIQSVIFSAFQTALIALMFEDDPDEEELLKKQDRVINNTLDTVLRGTGLYGVFLSTAKNVALELYEQQVIKPEKGKRPDNARVLIEALNVSPPIGIKAREFYGAIKGYEFNKDVISEIGLDINNPALDISANVASSLFNIPINRAINKARNLNAAADAETETWQKIALTLGWNTWDVGLQGEKLDKIKKEIREVNKELRKPKKIKRAKR